MKAILFSIGLLMMVICCQAQTEVTLTQKRFSKNWFNNIDKAVANADSVFYLDLSLQKLKTFPTEIFKLKNLKELYLSYNYWENIPEGLSGLQQLVLLDLSGNYYLNKLPKDLSKLKLLKELDLKDNKLNKGEAEALKSALPKTDVQVTVHK